MNALKKLIVLTGFSVLCAVAISVLCAVTTMAQIINRVTFDAPFVFYAGNTKMPAGSYTVTQPDPDTGLLLIEDANGSHSVFVECVVANSDIPQSKSDVTFKKYGKIDFLSAIRVEGQNSEMQLLPSKFEQSAAKAAGPDKHSLSASSGKP